MLRTARPNTACRWSADEDTPGRHGESADFLESKMLGLTLKADILFSLEVLGDLQIQALNHVPQQRNMDKLRGDRR